MSYLYQQAGRDYIVFERNDVAGSFYVRYPRHRTLISINKRFTGSTNHEFNLRHDWNSLISNNRSLELRHYTDEYFPNADTYVQYLNDYASANHLNIQYNTNITRVEKEGSLFHLTDQHGTVYTCDMLIVSTGISTQYVPNVAGMELVERYDTMSVDPEDFIDQRVLILGRGNSGYETATNLVGAAAFIHLGSRHRMKQAHQTHYVGDLRAINNQLVDTYQLKSLDAFMTFDFDTDKRVGIRKNDAGEFEICFQPNETARDNSIEARTAVYDRVLLCTGFKFDFSLFGNSIKQGGVFNNKYPAVKPNYESTETSGMYFAGTNTHSVDYRRSAGGFIHGFRYTTRSLFRHLEWRYHQVPWPYVTLAATDVTDHIIQRINEASALYQMFGVLSDVVFIRDDYTGVYLEDVPIGAMTDAKGLTGHENGPFIIINYEYGPGFSGPGRDILDDGQGFTLAEQADKCGFLHPVLYYYEKTDDLTWNNITGKVESGTPPQVHHIAEDLHTDWTARNSHVIPLRRFVESLFKEDLRDYTIDSCFKLFLSHGWSLPLACKQHYLAGQLVDLPSM